MLKQSRLPIKRSKAENECYAVKQVQGPMPGPEVEYPCLRGHQLDEKEGEREVEGPLDIHTDEFESGDDLANGVQAVDGARSAL